jgi:hypothetical protein
MTSVDRKMRASDLQLHACLYTRLLCYIPFLPLALPAWSAEAPPAAEPAAPPSGVIQAVIPDYEIELMGVKNQRLKLRAEEGQVTVPRGLYVVIHWRLSRRDRQGRVWEATFIPIQRQWFKVGAAPVNLEMKGDLTTVTTAQLSGSTAMFTFHLEAGSGRLSNLTFNGERPPAPDLRVIDEKGRTVARVPSKYG